MSIADGVVLVGAAPEWSIDGDMLAFSAMPADLSTGPDVYLWKVGDPKAVRLTQDHRSFFASWAADRIVISRLPAGHAGAAVSSPAAGPVDASTVVMDLTSGEQRVANGPSLWLPAVDPSGTTAVAWIGRLRSDGRQVTLHAGGLYLVDWTAIDPFAPAVAAGTGDTSADPTETDTPGGTAAGTQDPTPTDSTTAPSGTPVDASTDPVNGSAPPAPTRSPRRRKPSPTPVASPLPTATPTRAPTSTPTAPTSGAPAPTVQAVDPQRDETDDPVLDWVVRWSADGSTVGIWVADSAGANWGRLTVTSVALLDGRFTRDSVLGPNLARRAFSMGVDRVAWVAPSDDSDSGDLRIRTWGGPGYGDLRIHSDDAGDGVPSF